MKKKIAIIGSGISGLAAAWALNKAGHAITVYEAESYAGGCCDQLAYPLPEGGFVTVDTGFVLNNKQLSPNLLEFSLSEDIDVEFKAFKLHVENKAGEYWNNYSSHSSVSDRFLKEINRFERDCYLLLGRQDAAMVYQTIQQFFNDNGYSNEFVTLFIVPMVASVTDYSVEQVLNTSSSILPIVLSNQNSFFAPTIMFQSVGGHAGFISALIKDSTIQIQLNKRVEKLNRTTEGVRVLDASGHTEAFDEVVICTDGLAALSFIEDLSIQEKNIIAAFEYSEFEQIYHSDKTVLSNHAGPDAVSIYKGKLVTINFSSLRGLTLAEEILCTVNLERGKTQIDPDKIVMIKEYRAGLLSPKAIQAKMMMHTLQGKNNTWFAGTMPVFGFHEDCFVSGLAVAHKLGAEYPFYENPIASKVFNYISDVMFTGNSIHSRLLP